MRAYLAASLSGDLSGTPPIYFDGEPLALLRNLGEESVYGWLQAWARHEAVMFSTSGRDLWRLLRVERAANDYLVVELMEVR